MCGEPSVYRLTSGCKLGTFLYGFSLAEQCITAMHYCTTACHIEFISCETDRQTPLTGSCHTTMPPASQDHGLLSMCTVVLNMFRLIQDLNWASHMTLIGPYYLPWPEGPLEEPGAP